MKKGCLERAYELARTGRFANVTALKKHMKAEGYNAMAEVVGAGLLKSLNETIRAAKGEPPRPKPPARRLLSAEERSQAARRGAATRAALRNADTG